MERIPQTTLMIYEASALARGEHLALLFDICESQKTISTKKLAQHLEKLAERGRRNALMLKEAADKIKGLENDR